MSNQEIYGSEQPPAHKAVGHGSPPRQRRFKESGNLKGRPQGTKNRKTIVKAVANEMHSVTESGKRRRLSILQLVLLSLRNVALGGKNVRAFDEFHKLTKAYQPQEAGGDLGYVQNMSRRKTAHCTLRPVMLVPLSRKPPVREEIVTSTVRSSFPP